MRCDKYQSKKGAPTHFWVQIGRGEEIGMRRNVYAIRLAHDDGVT